VASDSATELEPAGEADGLVADPLHQAAVAGDDPGAVVDQVGAEAGGQVPFGDGHANGGRQALAERTGGGLDARRVAVFGVAGGLRAELAEGLQLVQRHRLEAGQVQQAVEQHRAVAGRQHEAVAVGPVRLAGVVFEELAPEHGGDVGHAHRHAGVAAIGLFDGVHRQDANGVGHGLKVGGHGGPDRFEEKSWRALACKRRMVKEWPHASAIWRNPATRYRLTSHLQQTECA
jgi:hypothetical protein